MQDFVAAPDVRLLHVRIDHDLRLASMEVVGSGEQLAENTSSFFFFESPVEREGDDWQSRIDELGEEWETLRELVTRDGGTMDAWSPPRTDGSSRVRFAAHIAHASERLRAVADGIVIVLAPVTIEDPTRWREDVAALLKDPALAKHRFVVVEPNDAPTLSFVDALGALALSVNATVSADDSARDLDAMVKNAAAAPPGASPHQLVGGAGPRVAPPPRPGPPPLSADALKLIAEEIGVPPGFFDGAAMQSLRVAVLGAALAMKQGDSAKAIAEQDRAAKIAEGAELGEAALVLALIAGSFVLQAGDTRAALERFVDVRNRATRANASRVAAQAELARGSALVLLKQPKLAAEAYESAGKLAETDMPSLAIEAWRTAGQIRVGAGELEVGATDFRHAIRLGTRQPSDEQSTTSASHAARELADICERHGQRAQAASLREQASSLEAGTATEMA